MVPSATEIIYYTYTYNRQEWISRVEVLTRILGKAECDGGEG